MKIDKCLILKDTSGVEWGQSPLISICGRVKGQLRKQTVVTAAVQRQARHDAAVSEPRTLLHGALRASARLLDTFGHKSIMPKHHYAFC